MKHTILEAGIASGRGAGAGKRDARAKIPMRAILSSVITSAVRSYSFVVFGDACPAIRCVCSSVRPFDRYAVTPVARNVWQHVDAGSPAAGARRLIIVSTGRGRSSRPLSRPARSTLWKRGAFASSRPR